MASIFDLFRREKRDNGQTFLQNVLTGLSNTGVNVNEDSSLTYSAVFACVRVLSESVASLPIEVIKEDPNGNKSLDKAHPIYKLLAKKPNNYMTSYTWRQILMTNLVLNGNSYFKIIRDASARPIALRYIPSDDVYVKLKGDEIFYEIKPSKNQSGITEEESGEIIKHDDMLHFLGLGYDGVKGRSVIETHRDSIGLSVAANKYGGAFYGNAATPSGILSHPGKLSKEAAERLKNSWNVSYGNGPMNAHKTAILEEGMSFKPVSLNPQDADFLNTRKFQVTEIARIFRVPPHMIGDLDRATFSNIEQQGLDFLTHTLRPYLVSLEEEIERKLFRENEQDSYSIRFNTNAMLRGDSEARAKYYKDMSSIGVLSINDIRRLENLNDIGPEGDQHYYALNYAPIGNQSDSNEQ